MEDVVCLAAALPDIKPCPAFYANSLEFLQHENTRLVIVLTPDIRCPMVLCTGVAGFFLPERVQTPEYISSLLIDLLLDSAAVENILMLKSIYISI